MRTLLVLGILALLVVGGITLARATSHPIAGINCDPTEQVSYHVHAFLSIVDRGQISHPPAGVGIQFEHLCLYWLHTHDASGIIHIESPRRFTPTLGQFFAVWGEPLSRRRIAGFRVLPGEQMRVYVGLRLYHGDPKAIGLHNHTSVTIEIGPPFGPPVLGSFAGL